MHRYSRNENAAIFYGKFECSECSGKACEVEGIVYALHEPWCHFIVVKMRFHARGRERNRHRCDTSPCSLSTRLADFPVLT